MFPAEISKSTAYVQSLRIIGPPPDRHPYINALHDDILFAGLRVRPYDRSLALPPIHNLFAGGDGDPTV